MMNVSVGSWRARWAIVTSLLVPLGCRGRPLVTQPDPEDASMVPSDGDAALAPNAEDAGTTNRCTSCGACEERLGLLPSVHVETPVDYADKPPTSGNHNPCWGAWGLHDVLPAENWVHNMEHGGIVLLHNCDGECDSELGEMESFIATHPRTILTEYPELDAKFAIVAWGYRIVSECWDEAAFSAFYARHLARAPEDIFSGPPDYCLAE
jgi:hypothetical protein